MSGGCGWFQEGWSAWCCQPPLRFLCSTRLPRPTLLPSGPAALPPLVACSLPALCIHPAFHPASAGPLSTRPCFPWKADGAEVLGSPARHGALSRSLSPPVSDVQAKGWQHSMALPVAVMDMPMFVAECARRERFRAGMQFSPDEPGTELRQHS